MNAFDVVLFGLDYHFSLNARKFEKLASNARISEYVIFGMLIRCTIKKWYENNNIEPLGIIDHGAVF